MQPFSIECTTCKARLRVRDEAAIGQILTCPKCSSMVLVERPGGAAEPATNRDAAKPPPRVPRTSAAPAPTPPSQPPGPHGDEAAAQLADTVEDLSVYGTRDPQEGDETPAASIAPADPLEDGPLLPTDEWSSTSARRLRGWMLLGGAAIAGIVLAIVLLAVVAAVLSKNRARDLAEVPVPTAPADVPSSPSPQEPEATPEAGPGSPANEATGDQKPDDPPAEPAAEPATGEPVPEPAPPADPPATSDVADPPAEETPPGFTPREPDGTSDRAVEDTVRDFTNLLDEPLPGDETGTGDPAVGREPDVKLPRPEPRMVNVPERLRDTFVEIEFSETPLIEFLHFVSDFSTIPVTLDADLLPWMKITPATPVSVRKNSATLEAVLTEALKPLGLIPQAQDGHLLVTRASEPAPSYTFKIEDLAPGPDDMIAVQQMVTQLIQPDSWQEKGGLGTITINENALQVRQKAAVQLELLRFFERLRMARGLPRRSSFAPEIFDLASRRVRVRAMSETAVSLNFLRATPLTDVVKRLAAISGGHLLIDWRELAVAGWNPDAVVTLTASDESLATALDRLLGPMDLGWRAVDTGILQITSRQRAGQPELEFYPVDRLVGAERTAEDLIEKVKDAVGRDRFTDGGGSGVIVYDDASRCLLASLSQRDHLSVERILSETSSEEPGRGG